MKRDPSAEHQKDVMERAENGLPDCDSIRQDAINAGGMDPLTLRFRVVEYERSTGQQLRVPVQNAGFREAVELTHRLIATNTGSHFCLEPVEFPPDLM